MDSKFVMIITKVLLAIQALLGKVDMISGPIPLPPAPPTISTNSLSIFIPPMVEIGATTTPLGETLNATPIPTPLPTLPPPPTPLPPKRVTPPPPKPTATPVPTKTPVVPPPTTSTDPVIAGFQQSYSLYGGTAVQILCSLRREVGVAQITGSGVLLNSQGLVLTNAHVGQYLLVARALPNDVSCDVKTGNPAKTKYKAKIVYIPPTWVKAHAQDIENPHAMGTGEEDFALVQITERDSLSIEPLPVFPHIAVTDQLPVHQGDQYLGIGYPVGTLTSFTFLKDLSQVAVVSPALDFFSFKKGVELVILEGSDLAAQGASGGPILQNNGSLAGVTFAAVPASPTGPGELRFITTDHINNTLSRDGNVTLSQVAQDPKALSVWFEAQPVQSLANLLVQSLPKY